MSGEVATIKGYGPGRAEWLGNHTDYHDGPGGPRYRAGCVFGMMAGFMARGYRSSEELDRKRSKTHYKQQPAELQTGALPLTGSGQPRLKALGATPWICLKTREKW